MLTEDEKIQGSDAWLSLRKHKITASEIPILLGLSEYMTPFQLWEIKTGIKEAEPMNDAMKKGHEYEEKIRQWANEFYGTDFTPDVVIHPKIPLILASLDGYDAKSQALLEAKTCRIEIFERLLSGLIPESWFAQMQIQMACTSNQTCYLVAYNISSDKFFNCTIVRDDVLLEFLINEAIKFKELIDSNTPPDLIDRDYEHFSDDQTQQLAERWCEAKSALKMFEKLEEDLKVQLVKRTNNRNAIVNNIRITKIVKSGAVDWKSLCDHYKINENNQKDFRKPSCEYFKISDIKET